MEYSRYSPCLPDVQEQIVNLYRQSQGLGGGAADKEKEKKKKKN